MVHPETSPVFPPPGRRRAEVRFDPGLVRGLLRDQAPAYADLPFGAVVEGWDNTIVRLGERHAVRLPRRAAAAPSSATSNAGFPCSRRACRCASRSRWLPGHRPAGSRGTGASSNGSTGNRRRPGRSRTRTHWLTRSPGFWERSTPSRRRTPRRTRCVVSPSRLATPRCAGGPPGWPGVRTPRPSAGSGTSQWPHRRGPVTARGSTATSTPATSSWRTVSWR